MAEKVKNVGVTKQSGFLYFLDKNGHVSKTKMARGATRGGTPEVVAEAGVQRESGWYISSIKKVMYLVQKWRVVASK